MKRFYIKDTLHNRYVKHIKDGILTLTKDKHEAILFTIVDALEIADKLVKEYGPYFVIQCLDDVMGSQSTMD